VEFGEGEDKVYLRRDPKNALIDIYRSDKEIAQISEEAFAKLCSCISEPCMLCGVGQIGGIDFADLSNLTVFCESCDAHFILEQGFIMKLV
jgi:hypothetical protein